MPSPYRLKRVIYGFIEEQVGRWGPLRQNDLNIFTFRLMVNVVRVTGLYHTGHCLAAVSSAFGGRRTMGVTAVNSAYGGRRTMNICA